MAFRANFSTNCKIVGNLTPGSVRNIPSVLDLLFDTHSDIGSISETLKAWGSEALAYNARIPLPIEVLGEADEIFQWHNLA